MIVWYLSFTFDSLVQYGAPPTSIQLRLLGLSNSLLPGLTFQTWKNEDENEEQEKEAMKEEKGKQRKNWWRGRGGGRESGEENVDCQKVCPKSPPAPGRRHPGAVNDASHWGAAGSTMRPFKPECHSLYWCGQMHLEWDSGPAIRLRGFFFNSLPSFFYMHAAIWSSKQVKEAGIIPFHRCGHCSSLSSHE